MKKIGLFNCYSASNSGDGLLVNLAVKSISERHGSDIEIVVIASDVNSFSGNHNVVANEYFTRPSKVTAAKIAAKLVKYFFTGRYQASVYKELLACDYVYSVGGGYLRFGSFSEAVKCLLIHVSQLAWIQSNLKVQHRMLAQSIGPFRWFPRIGLKRVLKDVQQIQLRDDRSITELGDMGLPIVRAPDLAVNELKDKLKHEAIRYIMPEDQADSSVCVIVLRDFRRSRRVTLNYIYLIKSATRNFKKVLFAVQSSVNDNDDYAFYRAVKIEPAGLLKEVLTANPGAIVVSMRLHGALESMLCGHKTFHLSYERKGFGAFEDLGLYQFVSNVYELNSEQLEKSLITLSSMSAQEYFSVCSSHHSKRTV